MIRTLTLTGLILGAAPLAAQGGALHPGPSLLFARPLTTDTTPKPPHRMSVVEGGIMGAGIGLLLGFTAGTIHEGQNPCYCEDPGLEKIEWAVVGAAIGFFVGASLTDRHRE